MAELKKETAQEMGLHDEQLKGRTQKKFFSIDESENLTYFHSHEVDTSKTATIDALDMTPREINREIRELMEKGIGDITVDNPMSRHGVGVGILNRLNLTFTDSLGYFGCGLIDGPNVHIEGRVGWSCAENMMAGTVVIDGNAGSTFGAAIRGGDLVCKGDVGARTGIDQKGGTIIVGGRTGAFSGFMMQRGRMIICGDAGMNLGDSMYDGTIYVGGEVEELGVDCVPGEMTELDLRYLTEKLAIYGIKTPRGVEKMQKYVSGKMLWNYASLEPNEKKLIL
ncbi:GXGXG motif-containing protein [Candidatus Pseudothioglobus singularis]|jgi:glutamate synthase domain-containing protein 3|nr:GXGXG motif-containing protein [Candidatus Pseudothioglobus singularis]MBT3439483.1 GXGXG motif-containing protein [Gammaproteobacteria bacterium]MDA9144908.1 GXGXG motif-containing protein [Candidatus Thioglobus sp.]MBT6142604.1 GXGXG motif-containing protein [Gammaproteobacteria bacterium]MDA7441291.1 GXGXG motif-containing protein [Candidatus Pseudothioglobus singularis]MDA8756037.1 GXGXG motif-containing protein [Candidatus Pseudothioglobus singularis]|tara:strand:- start:54 stop:896 length:843 start_codon:yes stop_codon:yes gene_type:complete